MGQESAGTATVLAILILIMLWWLPRRTSKGMKQIAEHYQDRYSPSLHVIDATRSTQFSDEHVALTKGAIMEAIHPYDGILDPRHIAKVRQLRHITARRRRRLAIALLAITAITTIISFILQFSWLFALIPVLLLVLLCILGARASRHARLWEQALAHQRASATNMHVASKRDKYESAYDHTHSSQHVSGSSRSLKFASDEYVQVYDSSHSISNGIAHNPDSTIHNPTTSLLDKSDIEHAVHRALEYKHTRMSGVSNVPRVSRALDVSGQIEVSSLAVDGADTYAGNSTMHADVRKELQYNGEDIGDHADETTQPWSQDLISFSLGSPRNGVEYEVRGPRSLEIKSTQQVARAIPPKNAVMHELISDSMAYSVQVPTLRPCIQTANVETYHESELTSDVEIPEPTSDSLSLVVEEILARRAS